ncbi:hypothetical protein [Streptomyces sp. NBC_01497]|uniref:hypothetical protein n=1 Tax=Streptomyces sp. NBC_01497 TaxID=2903885 RepID=UPI002E323A69|nr:hypothetical protein [Streptomyces sp. NBC_01497]
MADPEQNAVCAGACGDEFPIEAMTELDGGMYQCDECMGSVILRGSLDEVVPREKDSLTRPAGDLDEAMHRGSSAA